MSAPPPTETAPRILYPFLTTYVTERARKRLEPWIGCLSLIGLVAGLIVLFAPHPRGAILWTLPLGFLLLYMGSIAKWVDKQMALAAFARSSPEVQIDGRTQAFARALAQKLPLNRADRLLPRQILDKLERVFQATASLEGRAIGQKDIRPELANEAAEEANRLRDHALGVASGARRRFTILEFFPTEPSPDQIEESLGMLESVRLCATQIAEALGEFDSEPVKAALQTAATLRLSQRHYVYNMLPPPS